MRLVNIFMEDVKWVQLPPCRTIYGLYTVERAPKYVGTLGSGFNSYQTSFMGL
jgi:hypothetical protein